MCDDRVNQYIGSDGRFICDFPTLARIIDTECDSQQDCRQDCCGDVLRRYMYGDNNNRISGCHYNSAFRDGLQQLAQNSGPDGAQAARRIEDLYNLCKRIEQPVDPIATNPMGTGWPPGYGYPSNLSEVTTPLCEGRLHQIQNSNKAGGMKAWSEGQTQTVTCNPGFQGGGVYRCVAQRGRDGSIQFGSFEGPDGTADVLAHLQGTRLRIFKMCKGRTVFGLAMHRHAMCRTIGAGQRHCRAGESQAKAGQKCEVFRAEHVPSRTEPTIDP